MQVHELIDALKQFPGDFEVILQEDPEGNGYGPAEGVEIAGFYDEEALHPDDVGEYEDEDDFKYVVVLWPGYFEGAR